MSCPQRTPLSPASGRRAGRLSVRRAGSAGVSRILICLFAGAVLLAGSAPGASRPAHPFPVGLRARAAEPDGAGQPSGRRFGWPLAGSPAVVRGFQPPTVPYGPGHRGVDLAAADGEPVLAAGDGTVVFAGVGAGRGVVSLSHPGGPHTTYEPVSATVTAGQRVSRGERIAAVRAGHPGCPVAVCLHWGAFRGRVVSDPGAATDPGDLGRQYLDPLRLIFPSRVRLLPVGNPPDPS
ncbi:MAG TPA: M23 family metallopeptidase [Pseudonocardiaceae bacterium]|nr:M23 family metallopeptidase [Pseudonocardiaceae bacterium]